MTEGTATITIDAGVRTVLTEDLTRVLAKFGEDCGIDIYSVELPDGRKLSVTCISDGPEQSGEFTVTCAAWLGSDIDNTLEGSHLDTDALAKATGYGIEVIPGAGPRGTVLKCTPAS